MTMKNLLVWTVALSVLATGGASTASSQPEEFAVWEFVLAPYDLPDSGDRISVVIDPASVASPDTPLDSVEDSSEWTIRTRPLSEWLTRAVLGLSDSPNSVLHPHIAIGLPLSGGQQRLRFPAISGASYPEIRSAYNSEALIDEEEEWLYYYLRSEAFIDQYVGNDPSEDVYLRSRLVRALIVYSAAVSRLVRETDWFAPPRNWADRKALLDRVERALDNDEAIDGLDPHTLNHTRVRKAQKSLIGIEHHFYGRVFRAFAALRKSDEISINNGLPPLRCSIVFPAALKFYKWLENQDEKTYEAIRIASRFTRTHVLNEVTSCFRMLLKRGPDHLRALDVVVKEDFGGKDGLEMARELAVHLDMSLEELGCEEATCSEGNQLLYDQTMNSARFIDEALPWLERGTDVAAERPTDATRITEGVAE